jgi:hypothetical protein
VKAGRKPGSVPTATGQAQRCGGDHLSGTSVAAGLERRAKTGPVNGQPWSLGLAPSRGLPSRHLSMPLVRSYRTLAPLPVHRAVPGHRRCVSVALSSRSPALGVTQQAWPLGSPDFPRNSDPRSGAPRSRPRSPRLLSPFNLNQSLGRGRVAVAETARWPPRSLRWPSGRVK